MQKPHQIGSAKAVPQAGHHPCNEAACSSGHTTNNPSIPWLQLPESTGISIRKVCGRERRGWGWSWVTYGSEALEMAKNLAIGPALGGQDIYVVK